jgi:hypothetical protein
VDTLEELTYHAGRDALADQESVVTGIRQRTGTLLAAQALVASFLGEAEGGTLGWLAAAGFGYQDIRNENAHRVRRMSLMSAVLAALLVLQTALWLIVLSLD